MRKLTGYCLTLLAIIFSLSSCQKEVDFQDDLDNVDPIAGDMRCKIDGVQWVADKGAAAARVGGLINISGVSINNKVITITLTDSGVHRYILSDETLNAAAHTDPTLADNTSFVSNYPDEYPANAGGELNITSIDETNKTMKGTFTFKLYRFDGLVRTITEGIFDLKYTTTITLPPVSNADTFRVKIGGVPFSVASLFSTSTGSPFNTLAIVANTTGATSTVGLTFPDNITPGEYTLDFFGATYIGQYNPDNDPNHSQASSSGALKILEHNTTTKRIRGNFSFHAEALLDPTLNSELTEGYFSVKY